MPKRFQNADEERIAFSMNFGGGMNTRKRADDLGETEATLSENTRIDIDRTSLRKRYPLIPFCSLDTATWDTALDGSTPIDAILGPFPVNNKKDYPERAPFQSVFIIQSGTQLFQVYWNSTFWKVRNIQGAGVANVIAGSKLHYNPNSYSEADGFGVITDLNGLTPVIKVAYGEHALTGHPLGELDVTYLAHGLSDTELYAKQAFIQNDRLWLGNIKTKIVSTGVITETPHLIAASARENLESFSVSSRPSSSLGFSDPFYLPSPDLKPINGLVTALGSVVFSTENGSMYNLQGSSSQDFYLSPLYSGSGASGGTSVVFAGNDIVYYSEGAVQTLAGAEAFGDVEVDDFSRPIQQEMAEPFVDTTTTTTPPPAATLAYLPSIGTLFVYKHGEKNLWAFNKSFQDQKARDVSLLREGTKVSAWSKVTSGATGAFRLNGVTGAGGDDVFVEQPLVMLPAQLNVVTKYVDGLTDYWKTLNTVLIGTPQGVVYYVDTGHDTLANRDSYTQQSYISSASGGLNEHVDLTAYTESFTVKHVSKVFEAPSGTDLKNITGRIRYTPRETVEPVVTVSIEFQGSRRRTVSKQITLNNHPTAGDYRQKAKKFSLQGGNASSMQVTVEWAGGELIEILGIDFTLDA